jgi:hypothetical protein
VTHALFWANMAELRVVRRLHQILMVLRRTRVVAGDMQMLAVSSCYWKQLLHKAVELVTVAIRVII